MGYIATEEKLEKVAFLFPTHYDKVDGHNYITESDIVAAMVRLGRSCYAYFIPELVYYGVQPEDSNRRGLLAAHTVVVFSSVQLSESEARLLAEKEMDRLNAGDSDE